MKIENILANRVSKVKKFILTDVPFPIIILLMMSDDKKFYSKELDDFEIPEFLSDEDFEDWWESLPKVEIGFDEKLGERQEVLLKLNQRIIDGYRKLAKEKGLRSGGDLMKIVLSRYARNHLLEDF